MVFQWLNKFHDPVQARRYELGANLCSARDLSDIGIQHLRQYTILLHQFKTTPVHFFYPDGQPLAKSQICKTMNQAGFRRLLKSWGKYAAYKALMLTASAFFLPTVVIHSLWEIRKLNDVVRGKDVKKFKKVERFMDQLEEGVDKVVLETEDKRKSEISVAEKRVQLFKYKDFNILWVVTPKGNLRQTVAEMDRASVYWDRKLIRKLQSRF